MSDHEDGWTTTELSSHFLEWVEGHPTVGLASLSFVIALSVVVMIPVGTPLTLAGGYICKVTYGWRLGLTIATVVAMGGCAMGSVACFLLGRYLMRDQVRTWIRKYPIFDAIDAAAGEQGLRIMLMLYLTPVLPLGPVSYMCGTTSIALSSFVLGKISTLPITLFYCFVGASTGALVGSDPESAKEAKSILKHPTLIASGIILSVVMMTCITRFIKKELNRIVEREKKHPPDESALLLVETASEDCVVDKGLTKRRVSQSPSSLSHLVAGYQRTGD